MSVEASLLVICPFRHELRADLDYPEEFYNHVEPGKLVIAEFLRCATSEASRELASCLDISVWDFNQHYIEEITHLQLQELVWAAAHGRFEDLPSLQHLLSVCKKYGDKPIIMYRPDS